MIESHVLNTPRASFDRFDLMLIKFPDPKQRAAYREAMHKVYTACFKLVEDIRKELEQFKTEQGLSNLGKGNPYVAIHIRGTDKQGPRDTPDGRRVSLDVALESLDVALNEYAATHSKELKHLPTIFVATDSIQSVQVVRERFPNYRVVCKDEVRRAHSHNDMTPIHTRPEVSLRDAKDVVLDTFLLSGGEFLVCAESNLAIAAWSLGNSRCIYFGKGKPTVI